MQLSKIDAKNFRLLHDVSILLEKRTTVIVGRNNCGKTSLTEVMRRLLSNEKPSFQLEDFSFCSHEAFWKAYTDFLGGEPEADIRAQLPSIEVRLSFSYEKGEALGLLSDFIVDLDPDCKEALVVVRYALKPAKLSDLFADLADTDEKSKPAFFKVLKERIPDLYGAALFAVDPNDRTNEKPIEASSLRALTACEFISAQRGLDDVSQKDRVVIGKVLENLFTTAIGNPSDKGSHVTATDLETAVKDIQDKIGTDFNGKLNALLPALSMFGYYPGVTGLELLTETTLDVAKLLTNHTKVRYAGSNGVHLPEAYNGLGARNIILIMLQLREFFKLYHAAEPRPAVQIVFIEEPEVHLHPQMQEVFIRKLNEIADLFAKEHGISWPVQFVVSTHSSHVANEAHFETIRYFLAAKDSKTGAVKTTVKDLRKGLSGVKAPERDFLHQYMTLTRCDLFFADKAVLIEGTTERLLLPKMIEKYDATNPPNKLGSQYLSIMEVGGAYAHIFFDLVEYLELRTLVITDIDSVKPNDKKKLAACRVSEATATSNACLKAWFTGKTTPAELLAVEPGTKLKGKRRIAFQHPEAAGEACGRSFEDAFILANPTLFGLVGTDAAAREIEAWEAAGDVKKSEFALKHALSVTNWTTPGYIRDGLKWLSDVDLPASPAPTEGILA